MQCWSTWNGVDFQPLHGYAGAARQRQERQESSAGGCRLTSAYREVGHVVCSRHTRV